MSSRHRELSATEKAVAARLAKARSEARFSQQELANDLGITRSTWANYEYARSPLPYQVAFVLCMHLNLNFRWLATGQEPMSPFVDPRNLNIAWDSVEEVKASWSFQNIFTEFMAPAFQEWVEQNPPESLIMQSLQASPEESIRKMSKADLLEWIERFSVWLLKASTDQSRLEMARLLNTATEALIPKLEISQLAQPRKPESPR